MVKEVTLKFVTKEAKFIEVCNRDFGAEQEAISISTISSISVFPQGCASLPGKSSIEIIVSTGKSQIDYYHLCVGTTFHPRRKPKTKTQMELENAYSRLCEMMGVCRDFSMENQQC